jgi:hypothetical protein
MSLDNILKRRALRLKAELSEGSKPKSSLLSVIYPAMDHGKNMPAVVKTPSSIPSANDGSGDSTDEQPEKKQKAKCGPGTSKEPDLSLPAAVGQSTAVTDAHKKAAFELGYFGENRSEKFISRCVSIITGVTKVEQSTELKPDVPCTGPTCPPVAAESKAKLQGVVGRFKKGKPATGND